MIIFLIGILITLLILFFVCCIYFFKYTAILVPIIFLVIIVIAIKLVDYEGYNVSSNLLNGKEALVFKSSKDNGTIYLLVKMQGDSELRLVGMPDTDENEKNTEEATKRADTGISIIKFGSNSHADGKNFGHGQNQFTDGIELLTPEQSQIYGKSSN